MSRQAPDVESLSGLALAAVVGFAGLIIFSVTDFGSAESVGDNIARFIYAFVHTAYPVSITALLIEVAVALLGGITVSRIDVRAGILAGFLCYFLTAFVISWFAAPV